MPRAKLAETFIHPSVKLRETVVGARCELLERCAVEYSMIGDASYLGHDCQVADTTIGKFCAIAAHVRIKPPNHPMERPSLHRFTYVPEYYDTLEAARRGVLRGAAGGAGDHRQRRVDRSWRDRAGRRHGGRWGGARGRGGGGEPMWRPTRSSAGCRGG